MEAYLRKTFVYTKTFFICAVALAFLGGAAMAFEPKVDNQSFGTAVFALSFIFAFAYIFEWIAAKANAKHAQKRDEKLGVVARYFSLITFSTILTIVSIVSLALH